MTVPTSRAAADQLLAEAMTEAQLLRQVRSLANHYGWLIYHTKFSVGSDPGYPDLTLAHPSGRIIWAELKRQKGTVTEAQQKWLDALVDAVVSMLNVGVYLWRPSDLMEGTIADALRVPRAGTR